MRPSNVLYRGLKENTYSLLQYSIIFYSILFYSILFYIKIAKNSKCTGRKEKRKKTSEERDIKFLSFQICVITNLLAPSCVCLCSFCYWWEVSNSWILNDIGRNFLLWKRKKIAKFSMRTFTCRSTFLYGRYSSKRARWETGGHRNGPEFSRLCWLILRKTAFFHHDLLISL